MNGKCNKKWTMRGEVNTKAMHYDQKKDKKGKERNLN